MKVETIEIDKLKPFERNPKKHPEAQLKKLEKSISEFGWTNPILATQDNMIVAGHARLEAAKRLNIGNVPVIYLDMPYEKAIAYVIADNRLAELAETDTEQLSTLLNELSTIPDFDIELTGFDVDEVAAMNPIDVVEDDFDVENALNEIDEPITVPGDIILLGKHRLMCGDSTEEACVNKLMNGHKADMVFTDPPYGVGYIGKTSDALTIQNDSKDDDSFLEWLTLFFTTCKPFIKSGAVVYVCHADLKGRIFREAFEVLGPVRQCIIWVKQHFVMGRQDYQWQHEPILYGWADGGSHAYYGGRKQTTIWKIDRPMRSKDHPTMKPIKLPCTAIVNSSKSDDIIVDFFMGAGSTILAAEQTNRICYGMELDPKYVDVCVQRWEEFTGQKAIRPNTDEK